MEHYGWEVTPRASMYSRMEGKDDEKQQIFQGEWEAFKETGEGKGATVPIWNVNAWRENFKASISLLDGVDFDELIAEIRRFQDHGGAGKLAPLFIFQEFQKFSRVIGEGQKTQKT